MAHDLRPTTDEDLEALGRFLAEGFHAPPDSPFAAADVLKWKYLAPRGPDSGDAPRSFLALDPATGRIVGHLGWCPGRWRGPGLTSDGVSTLHMIDWLSSKEGAGVGVTLMRRANRAAETQYGVGGSKDGRGVADRSGYGLVRSVPVYQRVLRPSYRLRDASRGLVGRALRVGRDLATNALRGPKRSRVSLWHSETTEFGEEVRPLLEAYAGRASFTTREPTLLNHALAYPKARVTGWRVEREGSLVGIAVLAVVPGPGGSRVGRIVELLISDDDPDVWHAAANGLTGNLHDSGADVAQAFASTEWSEAAFQACGYSRTHDLGFRLRDRSNLVPRVAPFHLTLLEADYAFL